MSDFTGERVIPGAVNEDLWAEHLARYRFATRFVQGGRVLDIGCGAGYGTSELTAYARSALGVDVACEAVEYASANYPAAKFLRASAAALPFADSSFDLITAFEVIEHLDGWRDMLHEARRVLEPDGVFLVSTPNKLYYRESRAAEGANPFHVHEFELQEFRAALEEVFAPVHIVQQDWVQAVAFARERPAREVSGEPHAGAAAIDRAGSLEEAHFFLAICGTGDVHDFLYVPRAANLLREREHHIRLLEGELALSKDWLAAAQQDHQKLMQAQADLLEHLAQKNRWALQLEKDWRGGLQRIAQLQEELKTEQAAAEQVVSKLEQENREKTEWALETERRLSSELGAKVAELAEAVRLLDRAEATVTERTLWAQKLDARVSELESMMKMVRESRWIRLGRTAGLGPKVDG